jgi:hypothetical protein
MSRHAASVALLLTLGFSAGISCASDRLQEAFAELGAVGFLQDFPHSRQRLEACAQQNDRRCLEQYRKARLAALVLFDQGRETALKRTLDAIAAHCRTPVTGRQSDWLSPWQACNGASSAVYFFASDAEDRAVIEFFRNLDAAVRWNMFVESKGYSGDWVRNRPDKQRWAAFIDSWQALDKHAGGRAGYRKLFLSGGEPHTGIPLLDPGFRLDPSLAQRLRVQ